MILRKAANLYHKRKLRSMVFDRENVDDYIVRRVLNIIKPIKELTIEI